MLSTTKCKIVPKIDHFVEKEDESKANFLDLKKRVKLVSHNLWGLHWLCEVFKLV